MTIRVKKNKKIKSLSPPKLITFKENEGYLGCNYTNMGEETFKFLVPKDEDLCVNFLVASCIIDQTKSGIVAEDSHGYFLAEEEIEDAHEGNVSSILPPLIIDPSKTDLIEVDKTLTIAPILSIDKIEIKTDDKDESIDNIVRLSKKAKSLSSIVIHRTGT
jgi:hypothetical protein